MKQVLIILIPVILLGIFMAGGFTGDPFGNKAPFTGIFQLSEKGSGASQDVLQIQNLIPRQVATIPTNTPAVNPTPTPTPQASAGCTPTTKVAVNLLLDTSGSMYGDKIAKLRSAIITFGTKLKTNDIVGIQSFSSTVLFGESPTTCSSMGSNVPACEVLSLDFFNQNSFDQAVSKLIAQGRTNMKNGFEIAKQVIASKRSLPQYQDYNWVLIFISDGIPNDDSDPRDGPDAAQDPTQEATQIENLDGPGGVRIITIGLDLDTITAQVGFRPPVFTIPSNQVPSYARALLQNIASDPPSDNPSQRNYYDSPRVEDLQNVYRDIAIEICRPS